MQWSKPIFNNSRCLSTDASAVKATMGIFSKSGFLKIPEKLNPRALHLLGKNVTENKQEVLTPGNWNFTLSEWDVL